MKRAYAGCCRAAFFFPVALMFLLQAVPLGAKDPKLKIEELVQKHLDSIGAPEARAAARNRSASGAAQVNFMMPKPGRLPGTGSILSDGKMMRIALLFGPGEGEQLTFDGNKVDVGYLQLRVRTNLADFVCHHNILLKEGLMGGTLTTAWPFLDLAGRRPRLEYTGLKKVDWKPLHEVKYRANKDAGDVQVAIHLIAWQKLSYESREFLDTKTAAR